jgi:hypothetical protein
MPSLRAFRLYQHRERPLKFLLQSVGRVLLREDYAKVFL